jgi:hypothetical protein
LKGVTIMGMTDKQFNAFLLMMIEDLEEIKEEKQNGNKEKEEKKLNRMIDNLKRLVDHQ